MKFKKETKVSVKKDGQVTSKETKVTTEITFTKGTYVLIGSILCKLFYYL